MKEPGGIAGKGVCAVATVTILAESCKGVEDCGLCLDACPGTLFAPSGTTNGRGCIPSAITDQSACTGCGTCMRMCPDYAIIVEKEPRRRAEEVRHG